MSVIVAENVESLAKKLSNFIQNASNRAIEEKGSFIVGVSGGSLVNLLATGLPNIQTDFSKWTIFFCDERLVSEDHLDSTFGAYKKELLGKINLTEHQFVKIKQAVSAEEAAEDYIVQMQGYFHPGSLPQFDMLLLGMGPDGHTCSLFPGHPLLDESLVWVAPITDSPKPPPSRITLTFPVINNAKCCVFAMAGEGKADMIKRVLVDEEDLPVTRVKPISGSVHWFLDRSAAKYLN